MDLQCLDQIAIPFRIHNTKPNKMKEGSKVLCDNSVQITIINVPCSCYIERGGHCQNPLCMNGLDGRLFFSLEVKHPLNQRDSQGLDKTFGLCEYALHYDDDDTSSV